jgi:hypothetical protein
MLRTPFKLLIGCCSLIVAFATFDGISTLMRDQQLPLSVSIFIDGVDDSIFFFAEALGIGRDSVWFYPPPILILSGCLGLVAAIISRSHVIWPGARSTVFKGFKRTRA